MNNQINKIINLEELITQREDWAWAIARLEVKDDTVIVEIKDPELLSLLKEKYSDFFKFGKEGFHLKDINGNFNHSLMQCSSFRGLVAFARLLIYNISCNLIIDGAIDNRYDENGRYIRHTDGWIKHSLDLKDFKSYEIIKKSQTIVSLYSELLEKQLQWEMGKTENWRQLANHYERKLEDSKKIV